MQTFDNKYKFEQGILLNTYRYALFGELNIQYAQIFCKLHSKEQNGCTHYYIYGLFIPLGKLNICYEQIFGELCNKEQNICIC